MNDERSVRDILKRLGVDAGLVGRHLIVWSVEALVLVGLANWLPGITVTGFRDALVVVLLLATINTLIMPSLFRFAVRLRPVFYPLITFLLNAAMLLALDPVLPNWDVDGWVVSGILAAILTVVSTVTGSLLAISDDRAWQRYSLSPMRAKYLRRAGEVPSTPGFIFLEIDGLAEPNLREAIDRGYAPNMASWLQAKTHRLEQWECDLSSQTSASQAGILLGTNHNVPAFRWYDKKLRRVIVSNHIRDTTMLQEHLSTGDGLLADDGASRGNLFSGDAPDSLFTFSTILDRTKRGTEQYLFFYANSYNLARAIAFFIADVIREIVARIWQLVRRERPRVTRGGLYPFIRAGTTSLLRELNTFTVAGDMMRGVPAVYTTYLAYDEVAHHSGIARGDTMRVLRDVDRDIGRLAAVATSDAPRPYHLIVLSDHGQSQGATFRQIHGQTLRQFVEATICRVPGDHAVVTITGGSDTDEGVQTLSALLTDVLAHDQKARPVVQRALRSKIAEGEVRLGPASQWEPENQAVAQPEPDVTATPPLSSGDVVVLASGSLGLISFTGWPERLTLEQIDAEHPALVPALVDHPGIGFVVVETAAQGPLVLGKDGIYILNEDRIVGTDPLLHFGANAARHLKRASSFDNAPDILLNSQIDLESGEIGAFEELVGSHGGLGGSQAQPFVLHPVELDLGPERVVGAATLFHTFKRWIAESGCESMTDQPNDAFSTPRDRSGAAIISGEPADA